jgi:large conductance mechanosensitive channel
MIREFKDFINRGNVVDLAVAVVLGAAFSPVVAAVVDRVLMPLIGLVFGEPNFDAVGTFACQPAAEGVEGIAVGDQVCAGSLGAVLTAITTFVLVGFALFLVVKAYNRLQGPEEEVATGPTEVDLLTEIRDTLQRDDATPA